MGTANTNSNENIDQLNSFLRGELSAVETYRIALEKLERGSVNRTQLEACMSSHQRRVEKLNSRVQALGGVPADSSGAWGSLTTAIESTAAAMSEKIAIAALESGEDHGLADYRRDADKLTADVRSMVTTELLPAQEDTHARMSQLKKSLQA